MRIIDILVKFQDKLSQQEMKQLQKMIEQLLNEKN